MVAVETAFRRAREHSVQHMAACERAHLRWGETAVSEIVMSRAATAVSVVPFTQRAEALSGADWVWWWVDSTSAYGMLVQAKRLIMHQGRWCFDFGYRGGAGSQHANLRSTAASLDLIPVYALYLGTGDYRNWEPCPDNHRGRLCPSCVKRSISLMPALLADAAIVNDSATMYERSVALEELWLPSSTRALLIPTLMKQIDPELVDFLLRLQKGARAVARSTIDRVLRARAGQLSAVSLSDPSMMADGGHDQLGPVFPNLPSDTGHWGLPYFKHALAPLRHVPPDYVLEIESDEFDADEIASTMPEDVAGVVVVRLPQNG
ncbi:hypothetical protein [Mycolicibacterium goodii]|uniref:hypothetical protein n=1 Tax=Mycolicibacterium goodii TaxID=134601 RepID=UPI001BDC176D|nr:hypothetical protein [Mycolicibacterium goodii]MBU8832381.1 hypothetical protein [Mycolicibacterium goodii]